MQNTVHIIGAGISGLSAAVRLANGGYKVAVHEATQQAGGRCRSYFDAATNLTIDNGNHLLLSGNRHALSYALRDAEAHHPPISPSHLSSRGHSGIDHDRGEWTDP